MTTLPISALFASLVLAAPLAAQTPPAPPSNPMLTADRTQIAACLRQSGTALASCVGLVAVTCVRAATGDKREAEIGCARREEAVWRERLGLAAQAVLSGVEAGARTQFVSLQIAWEGYVVQKCAFFGSVQPPARDAGLRAGCELREVADRSLELERFVTQRTETARRPAGRPEIFR